MKQKDLNKPKAPFTLSERHIYLLCFYVLCRLTILLFYDAYVTDVGFYLDIAKQGLATPAKAYQDFAFGYPPLALLFMYLPGYFSNLEFWDYWRAFRAQMFFIDIGLFAGCFYLLIEKFRFTDKQLSIFVGFFALFGFLQGHLLYDRIDLLIVASLFALFASFIYDSGQLWRMRFLSLLGLLVKFVPFLYALVLNLIPQQMALSKNKRQSSALLGALIKNGILELILLLLPFYLFIALYESTVAKGVFADLNMHVQRGIQVESTWATPVIIKHLLSNPNEKFAANNFGAQHLDEQKVPGWYLSFSKIAGILVLSAFGIYLFLRVLPRLAKNDVAKALSPPLATLIWLSVFLLFLSTQRVLSPQFFIWLMIPLAMQLAFEFDQRLAWLATLTYVLTYVGFDIGYWRFVEGHRFFVAVVAARNVCLIALTIYTLNKLKNFGRINAP